MTSLPLAMAMFSCHTTTKGRGMMGMQRRKKLSLVESEAFVWAFSPGSILEPGLKGFHRCGH
jgi:hypothetical protein